MDHRRWIFCWQDRLLKFDNISSQQAHFVESTWNPRGSITWNHVYFWWYMQIKFTWIISRGTHVVSPQRNHVYFRWHMQLNFTWIISRRIHVVSPQRHHVYLWWYMQIKFTWIISRGIHVVWPQRNHVYFRWHIQMHSTWIISRRIHVVSPQRHHVYLWWYMQIKFTWIISRGIHVVWPQRNHVYFRWHIQMNSTWIISRRIHVVSPQRHHVYLWWYMQMNSTWIIPRGIHVFWPHDSSFQFPPGLPSTVPPIQLAKTFQQLPPQTDTHCICLHNFYYNLYYSDTVHVAQLGPTHIRQSQRYYSMWVGDKDFKKLIYYLVYPASLLLKYALSIKAFFNYLLSRQCVQIYWTQSNRRKSKSFCKPNVPYKFAVQQKTYFRFTLWTKRP